MLIHKAQLIIFEFNLYYHQFLHQLYMNNYYLYIIILTINTNLQINYNYNQL